MRWWGSLSEEGGQGLDVVHRVAEDVHLAHLLHAGCSRYVPLEHVKSVIDALDAIALTGVPPRHLDVLRRGDCIAMHWMEGHQPCPRFHGVTTTSPWIRIYFNL